MAIEFNKYNYGNFNFAINNKVAEEATKKAEAAKKEEIVSTNEFLGLTNEADLLTKNASNLYRTELKVTTAEDRKIAETTNEILASLGYSYKVTASQVASVSNNVQKEVLPTLNGVDEEAVATRIADPNGPFAELFA